MSSLITTWHRQVHAVVLAERTELRELLVAAGERRVLDLALAHLPSGVGVGKEERALARGIGTAIDLWLAVMVSVLTQ